MHVSMPRPALIAGLFALLALGWTSPNEAIRTAAPDSDLQPREDECTPPDRCSMVAGGYLTHWVSRTGAGNLFLVMQTDCSDLARCNAWFVERTPKGVGMRLNLEGQFRVLNSGKPIPDVQTWREVSDSETVYTRYSWVAGAFLKVETRTVYRVNGVECGTALECYQAAVDAHQKRMTDKALRIWETVHKLSFI